MSKREEKVHVWQPSLLELYGIDQCHRTTKNVLDLQVVKQFFYLTLEDSRHNVRPILGLLAWQQIHKDVRMPRVARKSDKKIRLPMLADDCHCVLIPSVEVSWGACKGSWQDNWNSYTSCNAGISSKNMVTKVVVQLCSQLRLVVPKVVQFRCLSLDPREAAKFLEQTLRSK
jgi:hypothetical protein